MAEIMTQETYDKIIERLEANELYRNSTSIHKGFQYRQFSDPFSGKLIEGQQVRREDKNGLMEGQEGFDESSARVVIYNFENGVLNSSDGEPAIQYPGHWEIWDEGLIVKVVADNGDTEEYWEDGVPVRVEKKLAERRSKQS